MPVDRYGRVIVNPTIPIGLPEFAKLYFGEGPTVREAASNIQFNYPGEARSVLDRNWQRLGISQSPEQYFGAMESAERSTALTKTLAAAAAAREPEAPNPFDVLRTPMRLLQNAPERTGYLMRQIRDNGKTNLDVRDLETDPDWMELEKINPALANRFYQENSGGTTLDEARHLRKFKIKEADDMRNFLRETTQRRIGNNELRQNPLGDWEEIGEVPDPAGLPGTMKKGWTPASLQTMDMLKRMGGVEALGLTDLKTLPVTAKLDALVRQGMSPEEARQSIIRSEGGAPVEQPKPKPAPTPTAPTGQVEGLLPALNRRANELNRSESAERRYEEEVLMKYPSAHAAIPLLNRFKNIGPLLFGGQLQDTNPGFSDPQNEIDMINSLRRRQGKAPISEEDYLDWLASRKATRR